jgi:hypothetical protein
MEWKKLFDLKNPGFLWFALAIIYLVLNFFVQGVNHVAFTYTMVYALAFLLIAITLSKGSEKVGTLFGLMTFACGMLTWMTSGIYFIATAATGMILSFIFFAIALLNEYGVLNYGGKTVNSKWLVMGALAGIFLFGLMYFLGNFGLIPAGWELGTLPPWSGRALPWHTILNHLGITLLAGIDMLLMLGFGNWEKWRNYRWIFFGLTVIGALGIVATNWGLCIA